MALQQYLIWPNVPHQIPYNINISCDQRVANFVNAMAGYLVYTVQEKGHTNAARSAAFDNISYNNYNNNFFTNTMVFAMDYLVAYLTSNPNCRVEDAIQEVAEYTSGFITAFAARANNGAVFYRLDAQTQQAILNMEQTYNSVMDVITRMKQPQQQQVSTGFGGASQPAFSGGISTGFMGGGNTAANRSLPGGMGGGSGLMANDNFTGAAAAASSPIAEIGVSTPAPQPVKPVVATPPVTAKPVQTSPVVIINEDNSKIMRSNGQIPEVLPCILDNIHILAAINKNGKYTVQKINPEVYKLDYAAHANSHLLKPRFSSFDPSVMLELTEEQKALSDLQKMLGSLEAKIVTSRFTSDYNFPFLCFSNLILTNNNIHYCYLDAIEHANQNNGDALLTWEREIYGLGFPTFTVCMDEVKVGAGTKHIGDMANKNEWLELAKSFIELRLIKGVSESLWGQLNAKATALVNRTLFLMGNSLIIESYAEDAESLVDALDMDLESKNKLLNKSLVVMLKDKVFKPHTGMNSITLGEKYGDGSYFIDVDYHLYVPLVAYDINIRTESSVCVVNKDDSPDFAAVFNTIKPVAIKAEKVIIHTRDDILFYAYLLEGEDNIYLSASPI